MIKGTRINGIAKVKFMMIGIPKMIGSLMPQMFGIKLNLPSTRYCSDLARIIAIANPKVAPEPMNTTIPNILPETIFGISRPALYAAKFSVPSGVQIGINTL
ncbi:hypothetical protein SDC9_75539 [bioreactor metagenome]|uniref:Uncharacterized protein n=1 Tax=bioreactor metagenome TaxID=1076179 RepID=A0A644YM96_9ZZZZ